MAKHFKAKHGQPQHTKTMDFKGKEKKQRLLQNRSARHLLMLASPFSSSPSQDWWSSPVERECVCAFTPLGPHMLLIEEGWGLQSDPACFHLCSCLVHFLLPDPPSQRVDIGRTTHLLDCLNITDIQFTVKVGFPALFALLSFAVSSSSKYSIKIIWCDI